MLIPMLLKAGHDVVVLDNLMFGGQSLLPYFIHPSFQFYQVDVCDRKALDLIYRIDVVIHLAALVGYPLCKKIPDLAQKVNVDGAQNIVDLTLPIPVWSMLRQGVMWRSCWDYTKKYSSQPPVALWSGPERGQRRFFRKDDTVSLRFATAFGIAPELRLDLMINDFAHQAIHQNILLCMKNTLDVPLFMFAISHEPLFMFPINDVCNGHKVFNVGDESLNYTKKKNRKSSSSK